MFALRIALKVNASCKWTQILTSWSSDLSILRKVSDCINSARDWRRGRTFNDSSLMLSKSGFHVLLRPVISFHSIPALSRNFRRSSSGVEGARESGRQGGRVILLVAKSTSAKDFSMAVCDAGGSTSLPSQWPPPLSFEIELSETEKPPFSMQNQEGEMEGNLDRRRLLVTLQRGGSGRMT